MKIVADESVDSAIVCRMRLDGHDVFSIAEARPSISDDEVLAEANQRQALLLTCDKDFGELVFRLHRLSTGVVLARLAGLSADAKCEIVATTFREHENELTGAFCVVSPASVRLRRSM